MPSEAELIALRRDKRERLLAAGDPYPARLTRTHEVAAAVALFEQAELAQAKFEQAETETPGAETAGTETVGAETAGTVAPAPEVTVAGRVTAQRVMGRAAFLDIRDGSGRVQLHLRRDTLGETFEALSELDVGDFMEATGGLFRTRTGEVTVAVSAWRVVGKALRPLPEKWHGLTDVETRYRQRYLDLLANEQSRDIARARADVLASVRRFFHQRGFMEVETPVLQEHAGGAAARPFVTHHHALDRELFLRIALELHLKQLLIGGLDRVFELGRVFRNEGISHRHNPEFTLLESYEAYADYHDVAAMVEALIRTVAEDVAGTLQLPHGEHLLDLAAPWRRTTYREALFSHAGIDYTAHRTVAELRSVARDHGVEVPDGASWGSVLDAIMSQLVEPELIQPTFVLDYPAELSPLAKRRRDDPDLAERFELFMLGYEVANAYSEQNDPVEQRQRMEEQAAKAAAGDDEAELADEAFLVALEHGMPPAGGLGIGIERLVMLVTGQHSIREVILFPAMREQSDGTPPDEA